jgi:hypothetical protein
MLASCALVLGKMVSLTYACERWVCDHYNDQHTRFNHTRCAVRVLLFWFKPCVIRMCAIVRHLC